MDIKEQLRDSIRDTRKDAKSGVWHSKAYHNFFEGYSEVSVPGRNGKGTRIERAYTADYYRQNLPRQKRVMIRVLFLALFLGAAALYVNAAVQPLAMNSLWYVVLPEAASLLFLCWTLIVLWQYVPAKMDLTIGEFRATSGALKKSTLGGAISLGVAVLSVMGYWLIHPSDPFLPLLYCAFQFLCAGASTLVINRVESKLDYLVIPNPIKPTKNAYEIK